MTRTCRVVVVPVALLAILAGCATNVAIVAPPAAPEVELAVVEQAMTRAKAAQQCAALAEQTRNLLLAKSSLYKSKGSIYGERKEGRNYSPEMKKWAEKSIVEGWKLAEEAAKLYSLAASEPAFSGEARTLAKAAFEVAAINDEMSRLALAYIIAGLEWNAGFLTSERETHFNNLIKKEAEMADRESVLLKSFIARLAQAGNKAAACPSNLVRSGKGGVHVLSGDSPNEKGLRESVLRAADGTSLAARHKKVDIVLKNVDMGSEAARTVANVVTFFLIGYSKGGDALLSASVQEEGGKPIPLLPDALPINAKGTEELNLLAAYWVIAQAQFALLRKDME